ncbi:hypothetical protein AVEN_78177-1, partial [Araneus ventricosus]
NVMSLEMSARTEEIMLTEEEKRRAPAGRDP